MYGGICRLDSNTVPIYIRYLSILGVWYLWVVLKTTSLRYWGTACAFCYSRVECSVSIDKLLLVGGVGEVFVILADFCLVVLPIVWRKMLICEFVYCSFLFCFPFMYSTVLMFDINGLRIAMYYWWIDPLSFCNFPLYFCIFLVWCLLYLILIYSLLLF